VAQRGDKNKSNDDRSNVKNPNNKAYEADRTNRIGQGHGSVPPPPPTSHSGSSQPSSDSQKK
jgi:hypothetical protein